LQQYRTLLYFPPHLKQVTTLSFETPAADTLAFTFSESLIVYVGCPNWGKLTRFSSILGID